MAVTASPAVHPVPQLLPRYWDDAVVPGTDWRIYACVVLGGLLKACAMLGAAACIAATWFVSSYCLLALAVPAIIWKIGAELSAARIWPDGSLYVRDLTWWHAVIPGQPLGIPRAGNNCCINAAFQITMASRGARENIGRLPPGHPFRTAKESYDRDVQEAQRFVTTTTNTQEVRVAVAAVAAGAGSATSSTRASIPSISPQSSRQEDAVEVLTYILDIVRTHAESVDPQANLPFCLKVHSSGIGRDGRPYEGEGSENLLAVSLLSYFTKQRAGVVPPLLTDEQRFIHYILNPVFYGGHVRMRLKQPSSELFILLGRSDNAGGKITTLAPIPKSFTLPPDYLERGDGRSCCYDATAFFVHLGATANSGHYVAYVKSQHTDGSDIWWEIDDAQVLPLYREEAERALRQAYLIHYTRRTT